VPVLGGHDQGTGGSRVADLTVDSVNDPIAAGDGQATGRIGKVVLDVDDDEGNVRSVAGHDASLLR
jgi:hypothetical protein